MFVRVIPGVNLGQFSILERSIRCFLDRQWIPAHGNSLTSDCVYYTRERISTPAKTIHSHITLAYDLTLEVLRTQEPWIICAIAGVSPNRHTATINININADFFIAVPPLKLNVCSLQKAFIIEFKDVLTLQTIPQSTMIHWVVCKPCCLGKTLPRLYYAELCASSSRLS